MSRYLEMFEPVMMEQAVEVFSSVPEAARVVSLFSRNHVRGLLGDMERRLNTWPHQEASAEEIERFEAYQRSVATVLDGDVLLDVMDRSRVAHDKLDWKVRAGRPWGPS